VPYTVYRSGNQKWTIQRNWQHRVHKMKKTKQKHNTIWEVVYMLACFLVLPLYVKLSYLDHLLHSPIIKNKSSEQVLIYCYWIGLQYCSVLVHMCMNNFLELNSNHIINVMVSMITSSAVDWWCVLCTRPTCFVGFLY
jgi:hypothetical protein